MKELQPINENVLLELENSKQEKSIGGIIIPGSADEKSQRANVIAIGDIENCSIAVGDSVVYKKFSGTEMEYEDKVLLLLPYSDVLAKIVKSN